MKRILLLMLSVVVSTIMMADDVTPEEALQQATQFVQNRVARGNGPRLAPGVQPKLTLASRVSDLYVFNVADDAGYIIVSNDDCAVPVLGYSDSGSFDTNNIPDNMRAWLQGYADEIAWAKANNVKPVANAPALAPQLTGTAVKTSIAPLIATTWNQDAPYNNMTPYYGIDGGNYVYSTIYDDGYEHCATGCVATAMAQVMKYHKWPTAATTATTAYTWGKANIQLPVLASTTFNWAKMQDCYTGNETGETATAVATLMKYCGYSVEMDYGPESGSNTHLVAAALKTYFDYDATTTTYIQRSFYSYANWIELIYHELDNARPVVYGGQSAGGGHEFVVDGYQSEDYFHINWGWGGYSDGYFKLSVLYSHEQGIGGSSSTDGFHYGQDAVIGIQRNGGGGTVLDVSTNTVNLSLNGVTFSENPKQYEEVTVTIDLKNSSDDVYDGDIGIRIQYNNGSDWVYVADVASDFLIPANTNSKIIQLKFTPEHSGTYGLRVYRPSESAGYINFITNETYNVDVVAGSELSGSNNVELSITRVSVDNIVECGTFETKTAYSLYGNDFKGIIRLTNNTENNYSGDFLWQLVPSSGLSSGFMLEDVSVFVPKNSHIDIDIKRTNIDMDEDFYVLVMTYVYNNSYSIISDNIESAYVPKPAILSYLANGTKEIIIPAGTSYDAATNAPTALSIDVTGTGITDITPNSNPNTLYISDGALSGLVGRNIVTNNNGSYSAESITLTDGSPFYSPVDFTATNIEFTYNNTKQADGTNGWNSLMLPFAVTSVTADDEDIDWFHSSIDTEKKFWVKKFVSDESNQVYFDYTDAIEANTPYIVAFPGNHWGTAWDLSGKTIKFIGSGKVSKGSTMSSVTGGNYRFVGSTVQDDTENIYCLNNDGNAFVVNATGGSAPFRAFFKPGIFDRSITSLGIASWSGGTTSIGDTPINIGSEASRTWYSIDGRRLTTKPTQKGIYIQNGKKVVIK